MTYRNLSINIRFKLNVYSVHGIYINLYLGKKDCKKEENDFQDETEKPQNKSNKNTLLLFSILILCARALNPKREN